MEPKAEVVANRDDPIQLIQVSQDDVDASSSEPETPSRRGWKTVFRKQGVSSDGNDPTSPSNKQSLQDRMFNKLFAQIIPTETPAGSEDDDTDYTSQGVKKPDFSLPVMGNNFRRFNARIGAVFVFQNRVAKLLSWRRPTQTISLMAVYSFLCLDPYLIVALPLALALFSIMIPAFASRHPPPPLPPMASSWVRGDVHSAHSFSGPALAPPKTIKPAPETSKDFFRNMRDLQNSMADFSNVHDALVAAIAPATNFSNEVLSSTIFLYLTVLTSVLFISAHLIPFRLVFLLGGNVVIISGHPEAQAFLVKQHKRSEKQAAQSSVTDNKKPPSAEKPTVLSNNQVAQKIQTAISTMSEITLSTTPETREVEIFELQYRPILPATTTASANPEVYEWTSYLFTPSPFDPLSPARIAGERPKGTRFFEDVQPPSGWEWSSKKWQLDYEAGEWVSERLIVGVEYDQMHTVDMDVKLATGADGVDVEDFATRRKRKQSINLDFGGWVWDLPPAVGSTGNRDEEVWLAYGDYDIPTLSHDDQKQRVKDSRKGHKKGTSSKASSIHKVDKDWEEAVTLGNKERTGEWRRRRWVRVVKRKPITADSR